MILILKTLGLALVAALATSLIVTSAASATNDAFTAESAPVTLTSSQHSGKAKFTLAGQAVECTTAKINATVNSTTVTEITTKEPEYSGCTYGGAPATIAMNGCRYIATGITNANGDAQIKLECPEGQSVHMTLGSIKCLVTIATQTAEDGYTMTTTGVGSTSELTVHLTIKTKVTSHPAPTEGIQCASITNGTGIQSGALTITGENPAASEHIGVTDESIS